MKFLAPYDANPHTTPDVAALPTAVKSASKRKQNVTLTLPTTRIFTLFATFNTSNKLRSLHIVFEG